MTSRAKNATRRDSFLAVAAGLLIGTIGGAGAEVDVSQSPLYVGSDVPGNLALVPSVEYPTAISVANLGDFVVGTKYVGYFDSSKCYKYHYEETEANRYFYPVNRTEAQPNANYQCDADGYWSGNFLNWAGTQTIDPFRSALTGGYRVVDTPTTTVVEKAIGERVDVRDFPRRTVSDANAVKGGMASKWSSLKIRVDGLGSQMWITKNVDVVNTTNINTSLIYPYNSAIHTLDGSCVSYDSKNKCVLTDDNAVFAVSVRVKVCDSSAGLEDNCVKYSQGYKPEGLIQQYSQRIKYSIFGYLNIDGNGVDTGVLRARQKFVGPKTYAPEQGPATNPNAEWDPTTGVLVVNPDKADADAATLLVGASKPIINSGVINYLNKFGQMKTGKNIKSNDDVSELYYAALRYFKKQGDVAAYSAFTSADANVRYQQADAFPVINKWNDKKLDPIAYWCQTNVILGIGDTNTHNDKNLPGNQGYGGTSLSNEPAMPQEVKNDKAVDVVKLLANILKMEGQSDATALSRATSANFNGNGNSGYIAALAYHAHTQDLRSDLPGIQTVSTNWVDVVEGGDYKSKVKNQYWLAGKYGGFTVPAGYDPNTNIKPLAIEAWWTNREYVGGNKDFQRADNFYVANEAAKMVSSLKSAFQRILDQLRGSAASLSSNTTKLESGAMAYQSSFYAGTWRGDVAGYKVDRSSGVLTQAWSAGENFPSWSSRVIKFASAGVLKDFNSSNLSGTALSTATQAQIDYLRGDRSNEKSNTNGTLRTRTGILGDIVNSQPVYVGSPNARLYTTASFTGASAYASFAAAKATRTPMLYVGANDGMLHGFDAGSGAEKLAFVPAAAMNGLLKYTDPGYQHRYYVDGELTVSDIYDTASASWRSILIGTMGRGGKGMFALDVTDPDNISLLWDKTSTDLAALGNNLGKPIIGQLGNGQWYAMVGNGPNNSGDSADLVLVNILSGDSSSIATGAAGDNGLSSVLAWSSNNDYIVDRIYAGDLKGNLWRFDMNGASGKATRLFTAQYAAKTQPITAAPTAAKDPSTGLTWVFFGTGKYLSDGDLSNKDVQTWYGLIDRGSAIASDRSTLNKVDIEQQGVVNGYAVRVIEDQPSPGVNGWYMDLIPPSGTAEGERMVVSNFFQGTALIGTTRIPDSGDVCSPSGKGFVMAINPFTGGRMPQSFFDLDGSGGSSTGDTLNGKPVSGIGLNSSPNSPIFIGNQMQIGLDNASTISLGTNSSALSMKRVSWRELLRND
ncbi:pilus assembly protein [Xanthomonas translucens]|uniref:pilus assembly protein n=1 Tax=Xanthomonas campestris pv. translucens TaxID=343 RepID=UPI001F611AC0|nr:pilus assembly protein [Xanthomonas translucens]UNT99568.1 pilus assembly protein [Xanthomonas translucens pv. translucens]